MKQLRITHEVRVVTLVDFDENTYPGMSIDEAAKHELDLPDEDKWEIINGAAQLHEPGDLNPFEITTSVDIVDNDNGDGTYFRQPKLTDDELDRVADAVKDGLAADRQEYLVVIKEGEEALPPGEYLIDGFDNGKPINPRPRH